MKVLVVDDNAAARDILVATLDVEGYTVFTAADGEECLRCAERELPDVILLDVMMPDESGYEVCSRLRAMPRIRETSVIMVTALTDRNGPDANPLVSPDGSKIAYLGFDAVTTAAEEARPAAGVWVLRRNRRVPGTRLPASGRGRYGH